MKHSSLAGICASMLVTLSAVSSINASAANSSGPNSRADALKIIAETRRILSPNGVEKLEKVRIGGIDQWLSIRGNDRRNPILLFLHGGPGYPHMPGGWYYTRGLEEYFTVVYWDQRGSGKTYTSNDPKQVEPTLTIDRMIGDTEEVITYLRREYGKDRIFVLGHSWGTFLGLTMAQRHPEWLHAYIGMGQITNSIDSEHRGWQYVMDHAQAAHDEQAIKDLQAIAPYSVEDKPPSLKALYVQRKYLGLYGGYMRYRTNSDQDLEVARLAPEYTEADVRNFWKANDFAETKLLGEVVKMNFTSVTALKCPVILFNGRYDYNVSSAVAAEWFERLQAPSKQIVWFENSGHMMNTEEPGKVLVSLVQYARPFAERAGDVPKP